MHNTDSQLKMKYSQLHPSRNLHFHICTINTCHDLASVLSFYLSVFIFVLKQVKMTFNAYLLLSGANAFLYGHFLVLLRDPLVHMCL